MCEKGAVGARAKVHKRASAGARMGFPRAWVCKEVGLHWKGVGLHMEVCKAECAKGRGLHLRWGVQKCCIHECARPVGVQGLSVQVFARTRAFARGFCTWILHDCACCTRV